MSLTWRNLRFLFFEVLARFFGFWACLVRLLLFPISLDAKMQHRFIPRWLENIESYFELRAIHVVLDECCKVKGETE